MTSDNATTWTDVSPKLFDEGVACEGGTDGESFDLQPLFSRLFVKRKELKKIGSIYLPESSEEMKPTEGVVVSIGPEVTAVSEGDTIYFGRYSGFIFQRGGTEWICMNEEDIIAKVI